MDIDQDDTSTQMNASEDDLKQVWFDIINSCGYYAEKFMAMRWSMLASEEAVYITSDRPVTYVHPEMTFRGIDNESTIVLFPISPTRVLCMDYKKSEPANQYYASEDRGASINSLVWKNAMEYMFCHRDPNEVCSEIFAIQTTPI